MMNQIRFLRRMAPPILGVLLIIGCTQSPQLPSYQREWVAVEEREPIDLSGTFKTLDGTSKWLLSAGMLLGRLELFTILVIFLPAFWRT